MTITGGIGTRAIKTDYPFEEGTTVETTKTWDRDKFLEAEEGSSVLRKDKVGLD